MKHQNSWLHRLKIKIYRHCQRTEDTIAIGLEGMEYAQISVLLYSGQECVYEQYCCVSLGHSFRAFILTPICSRLFNLN